MIVCWNCGGYVTKIIISSVVFFLFIFLHHLQHDDIVINVDFTDNDRELFAMLEEVRFSMDSISAFFIHKNLTQFFSIKGTLCLVLNKKLY